MAKIKRQFTIDYSPPDLHKMEPDERVWRAAELAKVHEAYMTLGAESFQEWLYLRCGRKL